MCFSIRKAEYLHYFSAFPVDSFSFPSFSNVQLFCIANYTLLHPSLSLAFPSPSCSFLPLLIKCFPLIFYLFPFASRLIFPPPLPLSLCLGSSSPSMSSSIFTVRCTIVFDSGSGVGPRWGEGWGKEGRWDGGRGCDGARAVARLGEEGPSGEGRLSRPRLAELGTRGYTRPELTGRLECSSQSKQKSEGRRVRKRGRRREREAKKEREN